MYLQNLVFLSAPKLWSPGIYLDDHSSNMLVERNVLTQQLGNGLDMHMGSDNVFRNNVIHGGVVTMANNTAVGFFDARQSRVRITQGGSRFKSNPKTKKHHTHVLLYKTCSCCSSRVFIHGSPVSSILGGTI